jgi:hypothetical protein
MYFIYFECLEWKRPKFLLFFGEGDIYSNVDEDEDRLAGEGLSILV